jgi:hypothetical protein
MATYLDTSRVGARPRATRTNPHTQLDQNAPPALQERIFALARALPGVVVGASHVSVPGARAFHLPGCQRPATAGFMLEREFAHLHPMSDGSLHMSLPPGIVDAVIDNGWAERHPLAGQHGLPTNIVMVYGPRDEAELEIVEALVRASHQAACAPEPGGPRGHAAGAPPPDGARFGRALLEAAATRRAREIDDAESVALAAGREKFDLGRLEFLLGEAPGTLADLAESLRSKYYLLHPEARALALYAQLVRELEIWK